MPHRHHIVVPQQHPVECLGHGHEIGPRGGIDEPFDELVDRRVLDAGVVPRARPVGGLRAPVFALLIAGRQRLRPACPDDVEVVVLRAPRHLRRIDGAHEGPDAQLVEILGVGDDDPLEATVHRG